MSKKNRSKNKNKNPKQEYVIKESDEKIISAADIKEAIVSALKEYKEIEEKKKEDHATLFIKLPILLILWSIQLFFMIAPIVAFIYSIINKTYLPLTLSNILSNLLLIFFMIEMFVLGLIMKKVAKSIDKEKDKNYIIGYMSLLVSIIALIIALIYKS